MLRTQFEKQFEGRNQNDFKLNQCISHFENSGYNLNKLKKLNESAKIKVISAGDEDVNATEPDKGETLVFPVHYFEGIGDFKRLVQSLNNEFSQLIGDTRIMFAMKKGSSLGNKVVRNKQLSIRNVDGDNQRCNGRGCMQCPLANTRNELTINDTVVRVPRHLNCRSKNVIYLWLCKLCAEKEAYFGRTTQKCQDRTSGHRGCFSGEEWEKKWEKSALSMHARDVHQMQFSLDIFTISVVKKVSPQQLRREEYKFIDKYRTISLGLNRYKV